MSEEIRIVVNVLKGMAYPSGASQSVVLEIRDQDSETVDVYRVSNEEIVLIANYPLDGEEN